MWSTHGSYPERSRALHAQGNISCLAWKGDIKIDQEFMTKDYDQEF